MRFQSEEYTYSTTKFDVVFSLDECIHLYSLDLLMLLSNAEDKSDPPDKKCSLFTRIQMTFKLQTFHPYPKINWDIKTGLIIALHSLLKIICVLVLPFTSVGLCSTCDFYLSSGLFKSLKSGRALYSAVEDVVYMPFMPFALEWSLIFVSFW